MLKLEIKEQEFFDEATGRFYTVKPQILHLEHSLISISKWESKWHKPYLKDDPKTFDEELDYVRCMSIDKEIDDSTLHSLTALQINQIRDYINDSMTATWFSNRNKVRPSSRVITSELIYYWMTSCGIPFSCEKWHLNRLLVLIRICNVEGSSKKKMNKRDQLAEQRKLNAARKQKYNTKG